MPVQGASPFNFKPRGLYDAVDGDLAPPGACYQLFNLIPDLTTPGCWVPRPAATLLADYSGVGNITALMQDGTNLYFLDSPAGGTDKPNGYDTVANTGIPVSIPSSLPAGAYPTTQATTGAWVPPTMTLIGNRIIITHPGYDGVTYFFGWLDISGVNVSTTGDTALGSPTINNVASTAGLDLGMIITGTNIPAGSYVTAFTATTITMNANATGTTAGGALSFRGGGGAFNPLYGAGNTRLNPLPSVPRAVSTLNNRAYFACGNQVFLSDVLAPCTITNASQSLTLGHKISTGTVITGFGQLPLNSLNVGGTVGSLIVFKNGGDSYWQISGDPATNNLALNGPVSSMPCNAPRTICQTPAGLAFIGPDGVRIIKFDGTLQINPLGNVRQPFVSASTPSRLCAAYNSSFLIIAGFMTWNQVGANSGFVAYFYDFKSQEWSGPHFSGPGSGLAWDAICPLSDHFAMVSNSVPGKIFQSYTWTPASPSYTENGNAMTIRVQSAPLPLGEPIKMKAVLEGNLDLGFIGAASPQLYTAGLYNETAQLDAFDITGPTTIGRNYTLQTYSINWNFPVVFQKADLRVAATASAGMRIGTVRLKVRTLGYNNVNPAS